MKKIFLSALGIFLLGGGIVLAQSNSSVGINGESPKTTLDIQKGQSAFPGMLPPRVSKYDLHTRTYRAEHDGTTVYVNDMSDTKRDEMFRNYNEQLEFVTSTGHYYFDARKNRWVRFSEFTTYNEEGFVPYTLVKDEAEQPTDVPFFGSLTNVSLGLAAAVTVPARSTVQIVVNYSVPAGMVLYNGRYFDDAEGTSVTGRGVVGTAFLRQEGNSQVEEVKSASRNYLLPHQNLAPIRTIRRHEIYSMITMEAEYAETYTNDSDAPVTLTYGVAGKIIKLETSIANRTPYVRFGMWAPGNNENFNWGRGSITLESYIKNN
ncbi:hypothetical protein [Riemerella columbipharyngis]|uniref:Uncharacterized protein n=1 Tax=Riemerella columbipharyngis TaxID=1071918 RepID=A0A1G7E6W8_9FLAO|nr:hypothetical protein [Riemerella columbipharyngis]SDE59427.1 hypothetical protein SAMN05421544_11445 [Riemerella columbipharyngis]